MALFSDKSKENVTSDTQQVSVTETQEDSAYLDGMSGEGLENFTADTISTAYLGMIQPGSTAAVTNAPGQWRNTATNECFGSTVEVIPLAFRTIWVERDKDPPYLTIAKYEPRSINVDTKYPKAGQRGFPEMVNPESGNKVEELFIYAVLLKDYPQDGLLYFAPTVSSMRACKAWNTRLRSQRLPSGKPAPIFGYSWYLELELSQNPAKPNNPNEKIAKFVSVKVGSIVKKELFASTIQPQLVSANSLLLSAPEQKGEVDEAN